MGDYYEYEGGLVRVDRDEVFYVENGELISLKILSGGVLSNDPKKPTIIRGKPFTWANVREIGKTKKKGLLAKVTDLFVKNTDVYKAMKNSGNEVISSAADKLKDDTVDKAAKNLGKSAAIAAGVIGVGGVMMLADSGFKLLDGVKGKLDAAKDAKDAADLAKREDSMELETLEGSWLNDSSAIDQLGKAGDVGKDLVDVVSDHGGDVLSGIQDLLGKTGSTAPGEPGAAQAGFGGMGLIFLILFGLMLFGGSRKK